MVLKFIMDQPVRPEAKLRAEPDLGKPNFDFPIWTILTCDGISQVPMAKHVMHQLGHPIPCKLRLTRRG